MMNLPNFKAWMAKLGKTNLLILCGGVGVLLIVLSGFLSSGETTSPESATSQMTTEEYAVQLEKRLAGMLKKIEGVGSCRVMVTMEQGTEYIYATQDKNSVQIDETSENDKYATESKSTGEQTYIMVSTKQGEQPLLLTELAPRVKGVVAVCGGGGDEWVVRTVTKALATALDIQESRICVVASD